jgi:hypothetical protein
LTSISALAEELINDTIKNEDIIICLEVSNLRVVAMGMFKLIARNYSSKRAIDRLAELSLLLKDHKFIGPWQFGHAALATLSLLENEDAQNKFTEIFEKLSDTDKYLVENFVKSEAYKE